MRRRSLTWLGVAVVATILIATALATAAAVRDGRDAARAKRARIAEPAIRGLGADVERTTATLDDLRGFFEASSEVTARDFARFAAGPLARQPSLQVLSWDPIGGGAHFAAPRSGAPPGLPGLEAARDELAAATAEAVPRMTPPLVTPGGQRVVMVVSPVYRAGTRITTPQERRDAVVGYVSGVSLLSDVGRTASAGLPRGTGIRVRDGDAVVLGGDLPGGHAAGTVAVAGRLWSVDLAGVNGASPALPAAVAAAGLLLAAVVGLLFVEAAERERSMRTELAGLRVRHDRILAAAGDGIIGVDEAGRASFVNPAAARMLGRDVGELTGRPVEETLTPAVARALREGSSRTGEADLRRGDGSRFPGEYTTTPIDEGGAVVTFRDITARRRLEEQTRQSLAAAEERAAIDPLTGLANHRTFHERLRGEVQRAARHGRGLALVLMDLDNFKHVNDVHGHQVGDRVLEQAARVLASETRTGDLVARVGGEEFAMILPEADDEEAFRAAERVRRAVASARFPGIGRMTISAGVCDLRQAPDADALYRLADGALYWAKHQGRDMVQRYSPEAVTALSAREQAERLERQQAAVSIRLLARVVDAKHRSTRRHSERVGDLCAEIARELGWEPERAALLREAGLVHDVGKIGVPDAVLFKPEPLTPAERAVVEEHAALGAQIVGEALTQEQASWVRGHHERWDGTGYPDGLRAEECPQGARILALADAWDVMTSERPYPPVPLTPAEAITECRSHAGGQFWAPAVEALARLKGGV